MRYTVAVLSAVLVVVPPVDATYLQRGADPARTGVVTDPGPPWNDVSWSVRLPGGAAPHSTPLILGGYVYVMIEDDAADPRLAENAVYRVNLTTAKQERVVPLANLGTASTRSIASDGRFLFVADSYRLIAHPLATKDTGWEWIPRGTSPDHSQRCYPAAIAHGTVYLGCQEEDNIPGSPLTQYDIPQRVLHALEAATGNHLWEWRTPPHPELTESPIGHPSVIPNYTPTVAGDKIILHGGDGNLWAVDRLTGETTWNYTMPLPHETCARHMVARQNAADGHCPDPFISDATANTTTVFVKHENLDAVDVETGQLVWSLPVGTFAPDDTDSMVLIGNVLYVAASEFLHQINVRAQREEFKWALPSGFVWARSSVLAAGGLVYARARSLLDAAGQDPEREIICAFDPEVRQCRWTHEFVSQTHAHGRETPFDAFQIAIADEALIIVGRDGTVSALGRTPGSISMTANVSTSYPRPGEEVTVDMRTAPGLYGPALEFLADWGDGARTAWQAGPVFRHQFESIGTTKARFFARNDWQVSSQEVVFFVGGVDPKTVPVSLPTVAIAAESPESDSLNGFQRALADERLGWTLAGLLGVLLIGALLALVGRARRPEVHAPRFVVKQELGRGSHARAFLARDMELDRDVVLKQPRSSWLLSDEDDARFVKEARVLAKLRHPNIVTVYEVLTREDPPTLVLEYVEGGSLSRLMETGPLDIKTTHRIGQDILLGLDHLHGAGFVHLDLKPDNVLLTSAGVAKIADFGIAKNANGATRTMDAQPQGKLGSPLYMSPEQARGAHSDQRSDLYSAAAMIFHMLTGHHHAGLDDMAGPDIIRAIATGPRWTRQRAVPKPLHAFFRKALSPNPTDRFQTAAEMRDALDAVARSADGIPPVIMHRNGAPLNELRAAIGH